MIRNIIFDWSGTLVDDLPAVWQASNHIFSRAGVPLLTLDAFRAEFSLPFKQFYDRYVPHVPLPELETWFHDHFQQSEAQASVVALPHAREFLEFCRRQKIRAFVLSAVHPVHFAVQQRATGLGEFVERPYVGIADKRKMIHAILAENSLAPDVTLFIGDMEHDIETARHGGIRSCAVLTGYNRLDQLRGAEPDLIVEHLGELREILERNAMRLKPAAIASSERAQVGAHPVVTVGGLIFDARDRVLMVRTHKWSDLWGIPGGKTKFGETSEAALRRELKEETNLDLTDIRFVLVQDCIHSREFYRDAHFVLLNYTCRSSDSENVRLNEEAQEFRWMSLDEACQLPLNEPTRILLHAVKNGRTHP